MAYDSEVDAINKIKDKVEEAYDSGSQAHKVKVVSGNVTLDATDIEIGAVEIKDGNTDNRATVNSDGTLSVRIGGINPATEERQTEIIAKLGLGDYFTNDIDDYSETNVMYIGKEKGDGTWLILKLDMNSGTVIRGASQTNNAAYTTYSDAWANRLTLTYGYLKDVV